MTTGTEHLSLLRSRIAELSSLPSSQGLFHNPLQGKPAELHTQPLRRTGWAWADVPAYENLANPPSEPSEFLINPPSHGFESTAGTREHLAAQQGLPFLAALLNSRSFCSPHCGAAIANSSALKEQHEYLAGSVVLPSASDEQVDQLRVAVKRHINTAWSLEAVTQGVQFAQGGNYEEALRCYDKAIELSSENADAHVARGAALANQRRLPEAAASFTRALGINPDIRNAGAYLEVVKERARRDGVTLTVPMIEQSEAIDKHATRECQENSRDEGKQPGPTEVQQQQQKKQQGKQQGKQQQQGLQEGQGGYQQQVGDGERRQAGKDHGQWQRSNLQQQGQGEQQQQQQPQQQGQHSFDLKARKGADSGEKERGGALDVILALAKAQSHRRDMEGGSKETSGSRHSKGLLSAQDRESSSSSSDSSSNEEGSDSSESLADEGRPDLKQALAIVLAARKKKRGKKKKKSKGERSERSRSRGDKGSKKTKRREGDKKGRKEDKSTKKRKRD